MNFKKRVNGSWTDTPNYIHKTDTDTITTLPAVLYPTGATATVGLKGQTTQSSIPSPTSPVMPQGTGERTGNLLKNEQTQTVVENNGITFTRNSNGSITANGIATARAKYQYYGLSSWKYAYDTDYFLSGCPTGGSTSTYSLLIDSTATQFRDTGSGRLVNVATGTTGTYNLEIRIENGVRVENLVFKPMLNTGSQPLPYEPFGVKIPISSANTTTPVYLGEVETTRKIKKLVLDGTENWSISGAWKKTNTSVFYFPVSGIGGTSDYERYILSTHFASKSRTELYQDDIEGIGKTGSNAVTVRVDDAIATTVNDFKAWLRDNNVTVWYVLATETTGIVNEPLMKIGDYVDTLSNVSIPVTAGGDTLSVDTTVQPSEVTVNYKGWHPVQSAHERENGAWA